MPPLRALHRASLGLLAAASLVACGGPPPSTLGAQGPQTSSRVSFRLFGYSPTEIAHMRSALNFQGKVFLAKYDAANPQNVEWVDCPTDATYRYVPSDKSVDDLYIENTTDLAAKLPLSFASFSGAIQQGKRLRVRFATAGSFELLGNFSVSSVGMCGDATHFVQTISVGAYSVSQASDEGASVEANAPIGGARGGYSDLSHQNTNMGSLDACTANGDNSAPPKGCQMPLEILLVPLGGRRAADKPPPQPDFSPAPSPTEMPRPAGAPPAPPSRPAPAPATAGATHRNCFVGLSMSGAPEADLTSIVSRCGAPLGLRPLGGPLVDSLAAGQNMHEYPANLEAGSCYRVFAVGGTGIDDLDTGLRDPQGAWVSKDILDDAFPILNPDGPFCVERSGEYRLLVSVAKGSGKYAVQLMKGGQSSR